MSASDAEPRSFAAIPARARTQPLSCPGGPGSGDLNDWLRRRTDLPRRRCTRFQRNRKKRAPALLKHTVAVLESRREPSPIKDEVHPSAQDSRPPAIPDAAILPFYSNSSPAVKRRRASSTDMIEGSSGILSVSRMRPGRKMASDILVRVPSRLVSK